MTMIDELIKNLLAQDRRAIARAISLIERADESANDVLEGIYHHTGEAWRIGITGPPGAGKSTLTAELAKSLRTLDKSVAIVAVDPTSPFTNGAVLGDRIRMPDIEQDEKIFIRSMATRGNSGGLSARTADAVDVFDAAGFDYIFVESVGVGQVELEIEKLVDTTIVVLVPESGDQVQAIKAGLMEIADIYVLNKSDRPGSNTILQALYSAVSFKGEHNKDWDVQVLASIASESKGIAEVIQAIQTHADFLQLEQRLQAKRQSRLQQRIRDKADMLIQQLMWTDSREKMLDASISAIDEERASPESSANKLVQSMFSENET